MKSAQTDFPRPNSSGVTVKARVTRTTLEIPPGDTLFSRALVGRQHTYGTPHLGIMFYVLSHCIVYYLKL